MTEEFNLNELKIKAFSESKDIVDFFNNINDIDKEFIKINSEKPTKEEVKEFRNLFPNINLSTHSESEIMREFFVWRLIKSAGDKLI
jgi:hypothetical protein